MFLLEKIYNTSLITILAEGIPSVADEEEKSLVVKINNEKIEESKKRGSIGNNPDNFIIFVLCLVLAYVREPELSPHLDVYRTRIF